MDEIVSVHAAKTHLSRLLARVEAGEVIAIARGRTPVAKLVPIAPKAKREFGAMRGKINIGPEFFEPLPEDELDRWDQWRVRLLLDTHTLIWWLAGDQSLSADAQAALIDSGNEVFVSAASAWEIATKYRLGRLPRAAALAVDVFGALASQGFIELPITVLHGQTAGSLPGPHRDPFDRMLIAQATLAGLVLVSNETVFDRYAVRRLWWGPAPNRVATSATTAAE
jgi:prevent-host-death family protein